MWSRITEASWRAVALVGAVAAAACTPDVRTVDVCGRGDRVDLAAAMQGGQLELTVVDDQGHTLATTRVPAEGARASLAVDGGRAVRVVGLDAEGATRAEGRADLGGGAVCVCLALAGQSGACAGLTCRVAADRCAFFDAATGAPSASRELALDAVDTTLVAAAPDAAHGDEDNLRVAAGTEVALLRFDTTVLPRTSVIEDATLELTPRAESSALPGVPVSVVPVLQAWDAAHATWNQRDDGAPWATPGCGAGSCADEPWARFDADRTTARLRVPLGRRIAPWVSGALASDGVALVGAGGETVLWSHEGQGAGAAPPRLVVHYHMADDDLPPPADGPICGNGLVEGDESCDDGDRDDTDACTNACQPARCGDGITRAGVEDCDDGNTVNDDGCSKRCLRCDDANADATFVGADGRCYARHDMPRNYGIAENACDEAGHGTLAVFEKRVEADTVLAALGGAATPHWIGLSDRGTEGSFVWATGETPAYDAFAAGEPAVPPAAGNEDCVAETAGAWSDLVCSDTHGYICERSGWTVDPDGRAWLAVVGPTTDWDAARLECEALSAHLAVLADAADVARADGLAEQPMWIGLSERGHEGTLAWVTGEPLGATQFTTPPALDGNTFCTELDPDGHWTVAPCFARRRFVCESE